MAGPIFVLFTLMLAGTGRRRARWTTRTYPVPEPVEVTTVTRCGCRRRAVRLTATGSVNGCPAEGTVHGRRPARGRHGHRAAVPEGSSVPVVERSPDVNNATGCCPAAAAAAQTYSLIFATFLGTMGLPHVLVRFYTNPDGRGPAHRPCSCWPWSAAFYLFPTLLACCAGSTLRSCW